MLVSNPRRLIAAAAVVAVAVTAAALSSAFARPDEKPAANPKVVALQKEKVEKMKKLVEFFEARKAGGVVREQIVIEAKVALGLAEFEVAATAKERIVVLERTINEAKKAEVLDEIRNSGAGGVGENAGTYVARAIKITTARIDMEIMLEKLMAK